MRQDRIGELIPWLFHVAIPVSIIEEIPDNGRGDTGGVKKPPTIGGGYREEETLKVFLLS